jgi:phage gpG-like protein
MISFTIDQSSQQRLRRHLSSLAPRVMVEVHRALKDLMYLGAQNVQKYFAGSGLKGGRTTSLLISRTGALLHSILDSVETGIDPPSPNDSTTVVTVQMGSSLPYARIQEYGGVAGRATFKKPGGRRPYLPPRPYLGPAFADIQSALPGVLQEAVNRAVPDAV